MKTYLLALIAACSLFNSSVYAEENSSNHSNTQTSTSESESWLDKLLNVTQYRDGSSTHSSTSDAGQIAR